MNVDAKNLTIENVLTKGKYLIPDYQREFSWTTENIRVLLDDIKESALSENYFIGHMVLQGDFNGNMFEIVDGQQRITTITIMLCAIRDIFFEQSIDSSREQAIKDEMKEFAIAIDEKYIFNKDRNNKRFVVLNNEMPYPLFQKLVQNKPDEKDFKVLAIKSGDKKIKDAYTQCMLEFKQFTHSELVEFRDKILNLELIFVAVKDEADIHNVFETLNAKGKELDAFDLIRNKIFKHYPKAVHLNEPKDSLKKIVENTQGNTLGFLNNFWASRYKKVSDKNIFREFILTSKIDTFDYKMFLANMLTDSELYKKIISPNESDWANSKMSIFISLEAINIFKIKVSNSIIIALLRALDDKKISEAYCIKGLQAIERFHFAHNAICSFRSSGLDTMYAKVSKEIHGAADKHTVHKKVDELIESLNKKMPKIEQFQANFDSKMFYSDTKGKNKELEKNKRLVQYALKKIEYKKQNKNVKFVNLSLEHICPETRTSEWGHIDDKLVINIGNIVLLDANLNSKVGQKNFIEKKQSISKSTIISTNEVFARNTKWDNETINARKQELIQLLYNGVWK